MDILDVTFFANEPRRFIYPATLTAKAADFVLRLTRVR
jgi:hypothetical protein